MLAEKETQKSQRYKKTDIVRNRKEMGKSLASTGGGEK